ncbi:MAG: hypothetical protein ACOCYO_01635 [Bacteroidota bacterium]
MIKKKLTAHFNKNQLVKIIQEDEKLFKETLHLAINHHKNPIGWRAAWIINQVINQNDERIKVHASKIIEVIKEKEDGHQRELLKIIEKMDFEEKWESKILELTTNIWKQVNKPPSLRIVAWRILLQIAEKYPEIQTEIGFLSEERYLETLSPGIKSSFYKLTERMINPKPSSLD